MTIDPQPSIPQTAPQLTADQLVAAQLGMAILATQSPARADEIDAAYTAPPAAVLVDAGAALRAKLNTAQQRITQLQTTLAALGV